MAGIAEAVSALCALATLGYLLWTGVRNRGAKQAKRVDRIATEVRYTQKNAAKGDGIEPFYRDDL